jgi:hypothetical protein
MKANTYKIISRCIEDGVAYGVQRAFKYSEHPDVEQFIREIDNAITNEICEYFDFEDDFS